MSIDLTKRRQVIASLRDKESRAAFVDAEISTTVPFQIREMRKARDWTQAELAKLIESNQPTISQFEDPDYATFTLSTLKKLAAVFDVALIVRFVPFSELVDRVLVDDSLVVPAFAADTELTDSTKVEVVDEAEATAYYGEDTSLAAAPNGETHVGTQTGFLI